MTNLYYHNGHFGGEDPKGLDPKARLAPQLQGEPVLIEVSNEEVAELAVELLTSGETLEAEVDEMTPGQVHIKFVFAVPFPHTERYAQFQKRADELWGQRS